MVLLLEYNIFVLFPPLVNVNHTAIIKWLVSFDDDDDHIRLLWDGLN